MSDDAREEDFLNKMPKDGSRIGNTSLRRELGWDEEQYWKVRNRLVDRGDLEVGQGRGGSVRLTPKATEVDKSVDAESPTVEPADSQLDSREADLYEPMASVLGDRWVKDKRFENAVVQITAMQGRRQTGGTWSRPDITVATLATYPYVPGRHFDVVTFEVKPPWAIDITAVYEALGHLRSATRAYVLLHLPDDRRGPLEEVLGEICAEAKRHGIGVIVAAAPDDYDCWDELVEPVRAEPEPRKLNDFLARQLTSDQLEEIVKWFR